MNMLLKYKDRLDDPTLPWLEDHCQAHCVKKLRQHPNYKKSFALAGDQNAGRRSVVDGARRKACGMEAGEPDLRLYFLGGRTMFFEMKIEGNKLTPAQEERIPLLKALGFFVWVITADCPDDAWCQMNTILRSLGGLGGEVSVEDMDAAAGVVLLRHGVGIGEDD